MTSDNNHNGFDKDRLIKRSNEAKIVRKIVIIVISALTLIMAIGVTSGYLYVKSALEPVDPNDTSTIDVEIPLGSSTSKIASILEENGIIKDSRVFRFYTKFNNVSSFQAGEYTFSPSMKFNQIVEALQEGKVLKEPVLKVTIPEGKTIEQIATIYGNKTNINKEDFLNKVNDIEYVEQLIDQYPSILSEDILEPQIKNPLEGYLFPATYSFYEKNPSIENIIEKMIQKTETVVMPYLDVISENEELTVHKALTMASLVENEATTAEDRNIISGVFWNRLDAGMMLQTDPTVLYAMGERKEEEITKNKDIDSPYNTYKNLGLPIGPISNFAENSLKAALQPAETDNMYFLAGNDGKIYYAKTYEEHQQNVNKYLK
ncbi:endolytic transglycosylase MltG [Terrihalobacillus insolitus]|uniref:endolytic transglycosylase MltG n=1 Tax=Terrihalobacillus insolitus TaxID=2950438 RepID=UPI0023405159|nr:endolytic transglycosylase MltG [Terrihalobacillus insolitus]MDC3413297.1 endolytic transglycosylase MltG [Terrihalobacillus insolitus]